MPDVHGAVAATYEADADFQVPGLVELFGPLRGRAGVPPSDGTPWSEGDHGGRHLTATYFDTADLALTAAGLVLRHHVDGDDADWQLVVPVADGAPSHVRVPLDGADDVVPDRLVGMTYARTGGRALVPVARVATDRTVRRLVDPTGRVLVTVADDRVTAHRMLPASDREPTGAGGATTWRDVRLEVVDGPPELLSAVDPILRERGLAPVPAGSALVRTLGAAAVEAATGGAADAETSPTEEGSVARGKKTKKAKKPAKAKATKARERTLVTAGEVAVSHIAVQVRQIRAQDLPVRLDHPGAVHAMRVASRRLRSALTTFAPLFDGTVTRPVGQELKWLAAVLGAARDAEVMRDRLTAAAADESPDARLRATVDDEVGEQLGGAYRAAHDEVLAQLDSARYRDLLDALDGLLVRPPLKDRGGRPAREVLPGLVARSWTALRWSMVAAYGSSDPVEHEELLHDARKAAKRARYAAEAVVPVFGKDARRLAAAMEGVQEALGEHLESMNTRARLHDLAARTSDPTTAFTLGRLHALEEVHAERSAAEVDAAWSAGSKKSLRRWLR